MMFSVLLLMPERPPTTIRRSTLPDLAGSVADRKAQEFADFDQTLVHGSLYLQICLRHRTRTETVWTDDTPIEPARPPNAY